MCSVALRACDWPGVCGSRRADDPHLVHWVKEAAPFIGLPPPGMNLTGWRDPFVVERPCEANGWTWVVLMGSGALGSGAGA